MKVSQHLYVVVHDVIVLHLTFLLRIPPLLVVVYHAQKLAVLRLEQPTLVVLILPRTHISLLLGVGNFVHGRFFSPESLLRVVEQLFDIINHSRFTLLLDFGQL